MTFKLILVLPEPLKLAFQRLAGLLGLVQSPNTPTSAWKLLCLEGAPPHPRVLKFLLSLQAEISSAQIFFELWERGRGEEGKEEEEEKEN